MQSNLAVIFFYSEDSESDTDDVENPFADDSSTADDPDYDMDADKKEVEIFCFFLIHINFLFHINQKLFNKKKTYTH